jgi:F-type H+-transporting ATPase subunit epsilon
MSLTLRVLAPDQSVFDGTAEEVILPSTTGQVGILPGHVTMLAALETGVMRLKEGNQWKAIALLGGFAEVEADEVTVLVNGAQLGSSIDSTAAETAYETAKQAAEV